MFLKSVFELLDEFAMVAQVWTRGVRNIYKLYHHLPAHRSCMAHYEILHCGKVRFALMTVISFATLDS